MYGKRSEQSLDKKDIIIFKASIARKLLHDGFSVVDIKPLKEDTARTVFIFKRTDALLDKLLEYNPFPEDNQQDKY